MDGGEKCELTVEVDKDDEERQLQLTREHIKGSPEKDRSTTIIEPTTTTIQSKNDDEQLSEVDLQEDRNGKQNINQAKVKDNSQPNQVLTKQSLESAVEQVSQLRKVNQAVDNTNTNGNATSCAPRDEDEKNYSKKGGIVRHFIAILALSSIVLANMNRQAFNQALVSMAKVKTPKAIDEVLTTTTTPYIKDIVDYNGGFTTLDSNNLIPSTSTIVTQRDDNNSSPSTTTDPNGPTEGGDYSISDTEVLSKSFDGVDDENKYDNDNQIENKKEESYNEDTFDWTSAQVGTLQAAFSYGYTPFMIPGGRMSELYGAKWVVFISGFGSALCCFFSPWFADTNYYLLVASRVVMGLCQTGVSPALYALLTRWLPPDESCVYLPMIKVGVMVGFMSGSLVSGFFTWRFTFYITGIIGLIWSCLWLSWVTSDPKDHKLLSKQELNYIRYELKKANKSSSGQVGQEENEDARYEEEKKKNQKKSAPWVKILTNPVVLAFMFSKFTVKLSTDAQSMQIPMYLKAAFKVTQELNGVLSAANFALQSIFTGLVAYIAREFVIRRSFGLSKTGVRRLFQGISNFGMASAYILITLGDGNLSIVCCGIICLSITSMFGAGGEAVTPVDLSTEYSASLMAIANSCANLSGIVLPFMISVILDNQPEIIERWFLAWRVLATIVTIGGLVFTFVVTAELQDFDGDGAPNKTEKDHDDVVIEMKPTNEAK